MVIYHIDMFILDIDMGDDSIEMVILHSDMGYLVTLGLAEIARNALQRIAILVCE